MAPEQNPCSRIGRQAPGAVPPSAARATAPVPRKSRSDRNLRPAPRAPPDARSGAFSSGDTSISFVIVRTRSKYRPSMSSVYAHASLPFETSPVSIARLKRSPLRLRYCQTGHRRHVREALCSQETAYLQVGIRSRFQSPEQLQEKQIAKEDRAVALLCLSRSLPWEALRVPNDARESRAVLRMHLPVRDP